MLWLLRLLYFHSSVLTARQQSSKQGNLCMYEALGHYFTVSVQKPEHKTPINYQSRIYSKTPSSPTKLELVPYIKKKISGT